MKKNIFRVLSLVLVAAMLFAFAACTQKVAIRLVDANGNDLDLSALVNALPANNGTSTNEPATTPTTPDVPATEATTAAPVVENTTAGTAEAPTAGGTEATTAAPAAEVTTAAPAGNAAPTSKEGILDFYKAAANDIKNNGAAGFEKKEWQVISNLNITGNGTIDGLIGNAVAGYMTKEEDAEVQVAAKGSADAKDKFPGCTLTDYSKVVSATNDTSSGNYVISIVMADEDTPERGSSFLGQITNSLLYWTDQIKPELDKQSFVKAINEVHVRYKGYKINATMTPEGHFVSLDHTASIDIDIVDAKLGVSIININLQNKSAHMDNFAQYRNFSY